AEDSGTGSHDQEGRRQGQQIPPRRQRVALHHRVPGDLCGLSGRITDLDCDASVSRYRKICRSRRAGESGLSVDLVKPDTPHRQHA
nr:hypothetical protein [Tanacetum cinerariifolium]